MTITRNLAIDAGRIRRHVAFDPHDLARAREIAEREQIPVGTAKTRVDFALRHLRVALANQPSHS